MRQRPQQRPARVGLGWRLFADIARKKSQMPTMDFETLYRLIPKCCLCVALAVVSPSSGRRLVSTESPQAGNSDSSSALRPIPPVHRVPSSLRPCCCRCRPSCALTSVLSRSSAGRSPHGHDVHRRCPPWRGPVPAAGGAPRPRVRRAGGGGTATRRVCDRLPRCDGVHLGAVCGRRTPADRADAGAPWPRPLCRHARGAAGGWGRRPGPAGVGVCRQDHSHLVGLVGGVARSPLGVDRLFERLPLWIHAHVTMRGRLFTAGMSTLDQIVRLTWCFFVQLGWVLVPLVW